MRDHEAVTLIQSLEPVFFEAGQLAVDLQQRATSSMKAETGQVAVDIVTSADLEVQEYVLTRLAKTALIECKLFAEEDTPTVSQFNPAGELILSLDPIGGTVRYARGEPVFSLNVGLSRPGEFLYSLIHHPAIDWTVKLVGKTATMNGTPPPVNVPTDGSRIINRAYGDPATTAPTLVADLTKQGYRYESQRAVNHSIGAADALMMGVVGSYYVEEPNVYDGSAAYHFGQTQGYEIFDHVDWTAPYLEDKTWHYPGYYVVLNRQQTTEPK